MAKKFKKMLCVGKKVKKKNQNFFLKESLKYFLLEVSDRENGEEKYYST